MSFLKVKYLKVPIGQYARNGEHAKTMFTGPLTKLSFCKDNVRNQNGYIEHRDDRCCFSDEHHYNISCLIYMENCILCDIMNVNDLHISGTYQGKPLNDITIKR